MRSSDTVALHEHVEDRRQHLRRDADARVSHADAHLVRRARAVSPTVSAISQMCPPGGVNFTALFSRLTSTWVSRTASPSSVTGSSGSETVSVWRAASIAGRQSSTAAFTRLGTSSGSCAELDLALRDARHVEQVVDDAHHVVDLAVQHLPRLARPPPDCRPPRRNSSSAKRIGASGLRSSWARMPRNSSLRLFDQPQRFGVDAQRFGLPRVGDVLDREQQRRAVGPLATMLRAFSTSVRSPRPGIIAHDLEVDERRRARRRQRQRAP